jgi:hypothetical protein
MDYLQNAIDMDTVFLMNRWPVCSGSFGLGLAHQISERKTAR